MMSSGGDDLTDDLFNKIRKYVYQHARISLGENKRELVRARFGKVIRQRKMKGFREYFNWMQNDKSGEALSEVMNAISTNLTSFFRENQHFQYLANTFLPMLAASPEARRGGKIRLRGWSAGCSTGEEVYSIAITLLENIQDHAGWDIKLLATDLDTEVVAHGQRGLFARERLKGVPPAIVKRYFDTAVDDKGKPAYQAKAVLRGLATFRYLNLFTDWPFRNKFNFIFCRNVMIYFDRETQEQLINRFYNLLGPGGHLFIGHSESLSGVTHRFEYAQPTIYVKR
ncbi:MAG: protein-glutamate O-methyltransferase CheR [Planctomycetota bacterium]|jgi:chemotaxis protein methyltransferase CheR|nr:protein-glutamate O-methyltransferase CheR [Planctomycetota bacterium]